MYMVHIHTALWGRLDVGGMATGAIKETITNRDLSAPAKEVGIEVKGCWFGRLEGWGNLKAWVNGRSWNAVEG